MRLGDLDDLKETIKNSFKHNFQGYDALLISEIDEFIDNAPTVEPFDYIVAERAKARQRGYEDGYRNGMGIGKTLNPKIKQGEWKFIQGATTQGSLKCPFCDYRDYHKTNSNFCPNCGADMQEVKKNDK